MLNTKKKKKKDAHVLSKNTNENMMELRKERKATGTDFFVCLLDLSVFPRQTLPPAAVIPAYFSRPLTSSPFLL